MGIVQYGNYSSTQLKTNLTVNLLKYVQAVWYKCMKWLLKTKNISYLFVADRSIRVVWFSKWMTVIYFCKLEKLNLYS